MYVMLCICICLHVTYVDATEFNILHPNGPLYHFLLCFLNCNEILLLLPSGIFKSYFDAFVHPISKMQISSAGEKYCHCTFQTDLSKRVTEFLELLNFEKIQATGILTLPFLYRIYKKRKKRTTKILHSD